MAESGEEEEMRLQRELWRAGEGGGNGIVEGGGL